MNVSIHFVETIFFTFFHCLFFAITEVETLKGMLLQQDRRGTDRHRQVDSPSDDLKLAKQEAAQAQESLKVTKGSYVQMLC